MKMEEIRAIARERGVKPGQRKKADLVRFIQEQEGNPTCFGSIAEEADCDRTDCLWRVDCLREGAQQ